MADGSEAGKTGGAFQGLAGQQSYFLDVPGTASAAALSVVSFQAVERLGEPYTVTIQLTHPLALDRADYLGREAAFLIDSADGAAPRKFAGWITRFSQIRQTPDVYCYEVVVEPLVARLKLTRASRIYQHKTAPQIIEAILRRHEFKGHQFSFTLRRTYPQLAFRMQYQCSDWDYIRLLMEQSGLYCYFTPGKFGELLVFGDDIDHYLYAPQRVLPYREMAGLEAGREAIFSLKADAKTIPELFRVADYNPDKAWERLTGEANVARKEVTNYGQSYVFGTHHLDFDEAKWEAQLRHEAAHAGQLVYSGESNVLALCPARILRIDQPLPDAPHGQVVTEVIHQGARDAAYRNRFKAIPSGRRFRLPLDEANWPRIAGTLSARITSPGQYPYAYLTRQGQYTVRFDFDFDEWPRGAESVPLWLAKPFAGPLQTGFHFPLIDGTYVNVAFRDGNPNKPYIAHVQHNSEHPDPITCQDQWMSRNVIRTQRNNKLRMEDAKGQEGIKLSTEYGGKSQLNLGYLVDRLKEQRGDGFELRTSGWGALRGGKGLFLAANDQAGANGQQLDMEAAKALLQQALQQTEALAAAAKAVEASAADCERQRALLHDALAQLKQAGILVSAPAGVALASGADLQCTAAGNLIATAGGHADVSVVKRFTVAAGELVSLFAQKLGIKLFAARGKVEIEAQDDEMRLVADGAVKVTSARGRVVIEAKEEILLKCRGSYLRMSATGIEEGTRGERTIHSAGVLRQGPTSLGHEMNTWKHANFDEQFVLRRMFDDKPMAHRQFKVIRADGSVITGVTDAEGRTGLQKSLFTEGVQLIMSPE